MAPALSKEILNIKANYRVWIHSGTRTWHDNNMHSKNTLFDISFLGFAFDKSFGPKKDYLFCLVFVIRRLMPNAICDLVLYFESEGLNIPWIYWCTSILALKSGIRNTVFYSVTRSKLFYFSKLWSVDTISGARQKRIYLFWSFWSLIFSFYLKRRNHEEHP